jgi:hypothetical protein
VSRIESLISVRRSVAGLRAMPRSRRP